MIEGNRADLHVHTTASDGTLPPEQTVREAARIGLAAVGIADHDTVGGIERALAAGRECDVIAVPAVEINTDFGHTEIHMLGYYIDYASEALSAHLERLRAGREDRGRKIVENLSKGGINISVDRVLEISGGGAVGRPHIARAIVEAGYARDTNSAFGKYLVRGTPYYVPRYKLTPFEALDIVREAGGAPVLAHPGINKHDELIPQLVNAGLKGLEVYHTDHSSQQARHYLRFAERYDLIPTGGSDSHGPGTAKVIPIGAVTVGIDIVHRLRAAASR